MPDIRYVCLSDTHFGASNSLLTNLKTASSEPYPLEASPVLKQLAVCLGSLISQNEDSEQPTLILNGDILELALNTTDQAAMAFTRFLEQILPKVAGSWTPWTRSPSAAPRPSWWTRS